MTIERLAKLIFAFGIVLLLCSKAWAPMGHSLGLKPPVVATSSSGVPFTPLHTFFMSPTGSDSNNGLSPATPWATPNHAMNCGDVIIAAAGTYSPVSGFGAVSNCPSTTGGIDGTGGIYFAILLCAGPWVGSCYSTNTSTNGVEIQDTSNWAVEGWMTGGGGAAGGRGFEAKSCSIVIHHFAFINDIAFNSNAGYGGNDCGANHNVPGNGPDYFAVVGSIAQNAALDSICLGAIDVAAPGQFDTNAQTHLYFAGNFAINSIQQAAGCVSDGEALFYDTLDAHGFVGKAIMHDNISFVAERFSVNLFYQNFNVSSATVRMYNNTIYDGCVGTSGSPQFASGDLQVASTASTLPYTVQVFNNIDQTILASSTACGPIYAFLVSGNFPGTTVGGTGIENIFKGVATSCLASCDAGHNVIAFNGGSFGTNIYVDPQFKNTTDLLANWIGQPNCTGFVSTVACMGYNGSTVTALTPISDLTAQASQAAGKGYRLPGPCAANADFPTWLKGVVYLQWNPTNSTISMLNGSQSVLTKPCGL